MRGLWQSHRKSPSPGGPFEYQGLPDSSKYLRLLKINHSSADSALSCHISHFEIAQTPRYHAVSYTWGDATELKSIHVNRSRFEVTPNLWSFLLQQRNHADDVWLWIDAICINQHDSAEKSAQVQLMGSIYQQAESVLIWLIPLDETCEKALQFLRLAEDEFGSAAVNEMFLASFNDMKTLTEALGEIFKCAYWERSWIIQEVLLAQTLVVCGGAQRVTWNALDFWTRNLDNILLSMNRTHDQTTRETIRRSLAEVLFNERNFHLINEPRDLYDLLTKYKYTKCKDVRDKVFAFLALEESASWRKTGIPKVQPDYTKSPGEIFFEVLDYLLKSDQISVSAFMETLMETMHIDPARDPDLMQVPQMFTLTAKYSGTVTECWAPKNIAESGILPCKYYKAEYKSIDSIFTGLAQDSIMPGDTLYTLFEDRLAFVFRELPPTQPEPTEPGDATGAATVEFVCKAVKNRAYNNLETIHDQSYISLPNAHRMKARFPAGICGTYQVEQDRYTRKIAVQVDRQGLYDVFKAAEDADDLLSNWTRGWL